MKSSKILWVAPLVVIGLICWLSASSSQTSQARILVESDINGSDQISTEAQRHWDPYFVPANHITKILIPGREQK
ncbi:MAG TPA: hypothetical protein PKA41_13475 [Verrucomicrobiota bacterium]|nr:hypothetical protein [Verrucomicrobiota bacterium]